jgi:hypothetical protein
VASRFREQHEELVGLADAILACAMSADSARVDQLNALRLRFARAIHSHCTEEAAYLRTAVAQGRIDPSVLDAMGADVVARWRADLALCNSEWPSREVLRRPGPFVARFQELGDMLRQQVRHEERMMVEKAAA